jgi:hypothetical protein
MKRAFVLFGLALILAPLSYGQWSDPINVSKTPFVFSRFPSVAFGPDGIVHMVWAELYGSHSGDVKYTTYDGQNWSDPITLTENQDYYIEFPFVRVSRSGLVAVVWRWGDVCALRVYNPKAKAWERTTIVGDEGSNMPIVALDSYDNIYVYYFNLGGGEVYTRSRINGVWENSKYMNVSNQRATEGYIGAAPDDTIWVVWQEKNDIGDYKLVYRTRNRNGWLMSGEEYVNTIGLSQALPCIAFDPNTGVPYIVCLGMGVNEGDNAVIEFTMNNQDNPRNLVIPARLEHYTRNVVDAFGVRHVATEDGPGDFGSGISYTNNETGQWKDIILFPYSDGNPKTPDIAADPYDGNIAICWDSFGSGYQFEAWVTFRYPVKPKYFNPPLNLSSRITYANIKTNPTVTYDLSWQKNPENNDQYLQGYRIFKKEGNGDWQAVVTVTPSEFSAKLSFNSPTEKIQLAMATVSKIGAESSKVLF